MIPAVPVRVSDMASKLAFMAAPFVAIWAMYAAIHSREISMSLVIAFTCVLVLCLYKMDVVSRRIGEYRREYAMLAALALFLLLFGGMPYHELLMLVATGIVLIGLALERDEP